MYVATDVGEKRDLRIAYNGDKVEVSVGENKPNGRYFVVHLDAQQAWDLGNELKEMATVLTPRRFVQRGSVA